MLVGLCEVAKGLPPVLGAVDMCDFAAVDLQMAYTPRGDVDFKSLVSNHGDKFLNCRALSDRQAVLCFPIQYNWRHCLGLKYRSLFHNAISGTFFAVASSASVAATIGAGYGGLVCR